MESVEEFVRQQRWEKGTVRPGRCVDGLATTSGKVEISSSILEQLGYDPIPAYTEPEALHGEWGKYPLLNLSGVRTIPYHHSEFRHVDGFRRMHPDPIVVTSAVAVAFSGTASNPGSAAAAFCVS